LKEVVKDGMWFMQDLGQHMIIVIIILIAESSLVWDRKETEPEQTLQTKV